VPSRVGKLKSAHFSRDGARVSLAPALAGAGAVFVAPTASLARAVACPLLVSDVGLRADT
jgi:hypothetical protein